jgi:hypothetical protein
MSEDSMNARSALARAIKARRRGVKLIIDDARLASPTPTPAS